jgi:hypothetical protein
MPSSGSWLSTSLAPSFLVVGVPTQRWVEFRGPEVLAIDLAGVGVGVGLETQLLVGFRPRAVPGPGLGWHRRRWRPNPTVSWISSSRNSWSATWPASSSLASQANGGLVF